MKNESNDAAPPSGRTPPAAGVRGEYTIRKPNGQGGFHTQSVPGRVLAVNRDGSIDVELFNSGNLPVPKNPVREVRTSEDYEPGTFTTAMLPPATLGTAPMTPLAPVSNAPDLAAAINRLQARAEEQAAVVSNIQGRLGAALEEIDHLQLEVAARSDEAGDLRRKQAESEASIVNLRTQISNFNTRLDSTETGIKQAIAETVKLDGRVKEVEEKLTRS